MERHETRAAPPITRQRAVEADVLADCAVLYELLSWHACTLESIRQRLNWTTDDANHRIESLRTLGVDVRVVRHVVDARNRTVKVYRVFPS